MIESRYDRTTWDDFMNFMLVNLLNIDLKLLSNKSALVIDTTVIEAQTHTIRNESIHDKLYFIRYI